MKYCFSLIVYVCFLVRVFAHPGIGLVVDKSGNVYYTDLIHVWKQTPDGSKSIAVANVHTHELYMDEAGRLYGEHVWYNGDVEDTWGYYIWCLYPDGKLEKIKEDKQNFPVNNELVRNEEGTSFYAQAQGKGEVLMTCDPTKDTDGIEQYSDHVFEDIRWIHSPKCSDDLYVVDMLGIKRVDVNGKVHVLANNLKERKRLFSRVRDMHYLMGMTLDDQGDLYVSVFGAGKVIRIDSSGKRYLVYESEKGWSPSACVPVGSGKMYILEYSKSNEARVINYNYYLDGVRVN